MTPEIERRLNDFEKRHKPDSRYHLALFREEVVYLHHKGYSLKLTFEYLKEQGVGCSLRTFERWVKDSIDFERELRPAAIQRGLASWSSEEPQGLEGQGAQAGCDGIAANAQESEPTDDSSSPSPKPLLLDSAKKRKKLHSETKVNITNRQDALARTRELREKGFRSPVERALKQDPTSQGRP